MKKSTDYTKAAADLLNKFGVKFSVKFITYGSHFEGDTESRDIFRATFSRDGSRFSIRFGQSFNDSTGNGDNAPTAYDVLTCLTKYDPQGFEDFCSEFGYDTDSRKAYRTFTAVCKEWGKVSSFFSDSELEQLQKIQ